MKRTCNIAAATVYGALLTIGLYHLLVAKQPWPGFTLRANYLDYALAPFWIASIASLIVHRRSWAWAVRTLAPYVALVHGMALSFGGAFEGRIYILASIAAAALTIRGQLWDEIQTSSFRSPGFRDQRPQRIAA